MTNSTSHLGEALAYEDILPISWRLHEIVSESSYFFGINEVNEEILKNILMLEKHHSELSDDESDHYASELAHIDFKLNLLLDLMVQVFSSQLNIPPECPIALASSRLVWRSDRTCNQGDTLLVDIYLSRRFPRPLSLPGIVSSVTDLETGIYRIELELEHISLPVQELLEKFIFLKHRRMIALSRRDRE